MNAEEKAKVEKPSEEYEVTVDFTTRITLKIDASNIQKQGCTFEGITEQVISLLRHKNIWMPSADNLGATLSKPYLDGNGIRVQSIVAFSDPIPTTTYAKPIWDVVHPGYDCD